MPLLPSRRRVWTLAPIAVVLAVGVFGFTLQAPHEAPPAPVAMHDMHGMAGMPGMSEDDMKRQLAAWYAAHPEHGAQVSTVTPSVTFNVGNFYFDTDGQPTATQIDTVHIFSGQWVAFNWVTGFHTATSGTSSDPSPGQDFDVSMTSAANNFVHQYHGAGFQPFFCRIHDPAFTMRGMVQVTAPADTFIATGFQFDADHNLATQIDTVHITPGQAVMFKWHDGFHTTTNGTGSADPNAGTLWNQNLDSSPNDTVFTQVFPNAGTFPFFCVFHETSNMKGLIIVGAVTAVGPAGHVLGFTSNPAPNPSRSGVSFRFSLPREGQARAEVLDAQGRRVASLVDERLSAGSYAASWDGRSNGARAAAGVYYVRLSLPGFEGAKRIAIVR